MSRLPAPEIPVAQASIPLDIRGSNDGLEDSKTSSVEIASVNHDATGPQRRKGGIAFVSSISKNEPVVTRRELWSYY
ncbi:hypothetical protein E1B28_004829, partial [Marasmius oreades]